MSVRSLVCECVCSVHELRGPFEPPELIPWIRISIGEGDKKGLSAQRPAEDILPNTHTHIFFLFLVIFFFSGRPCSRLPWFKITVHYHRPWNQSLPYLIVGNLLQSCPFLFIQPHAVVFFFFCLPMWDTLTCSDVLNAGITGWGASLPNSSDMTWRLVRAQSRCLHAYVQKQAREILVMRPCKRKKNKTGKWDSHASRGRTAVCGQRAVGALHLGQPREKTAPPNYVHLWLKRNFQTETRAFQTVSSSHQNAQRWCHQMRI